MEFDSERKGSGTMEWAEVNENICLGCSNNCLYCYAAAKAKRFKRRERELWHVEELTKKAGMTSYPARRDKVIMFPSAHDITPFNVEAYIRVAELILKKGNRLLIVSKPRLECVELLLARLWPWHERILLRFTMGTNNRGDSLFWEPGAPDPEERLRCLALAHSSGWKTSVSIEPMLGGFFTTVGVVEAVRELVNETIWIGKMNKARLRVDLRVPENLRAVKEVELLQGDEAILCLYDHYKEDPIIRWKDSIRKVVERNRKEACDV